MKRRLLIIAAVVVLAGAGAAFADDEDCEAPVGDWQPRSAVVRMAEERGWTVQRIKTDDGCYEILCTDETGRPFEAIVDPVTLKVLATEVRDPGRDRDRDRDRDHRDPRRDGRFYGEDDDDHGRGGERHGHDDDDDEGGGRAVPQNGPTDPNAPLPDNGLFKGKVRPKVQVQ